MICSRLPIAPKTQWICSRERTHSNDIHSILSSHVETVALLSKLDVDEHIKIEIGKEELDEVEFSKKETDEEIKEYIYKKYG